MGTKGFVTTVIAVSVCACPVFFLAWVFIVATVNFHDLLLVACVFCVQYHVRRFRIEGRERERMIRHEVRRRSLRLLDGKLTENSGESWTGPVEYERMPA